MAIQKLKLRKATGKYEGVACIVAHPIIETEFIIIAPDSGMLQRVANLLRLDLNTRKNKPVEAEIKPFDR